MLSAVPGTLLLYRLHRTLELLSGISIEIGGYLVLPRYGSSVMRRVSFFFFFLWPSLLFSSSTRRRFYPQRSSGQAVVTGVVPSPPGYVPSFLSRIGFSIPTARRFFIEFC